MIARLVHWALELVQRANSILNNLQNRIKMNEADKYAFEQIKQQYSMPFLQIGMNAIVNKNAVKVIGVSSGGLKGKLVNYNKIVHFHPTWETAYYNAKWEIIKDYRTK